MGFFRNIFYILIFIIILIIITFIIFYYYFKKFSNYNYNNFIKLQGFDKLKKEQHLLRNFIYKTPNINKRFIVKNLINKYENYFLKYIYKKYSKNIVCNNNNQINTNLITEYSKIPKKKHIIIINEILDKIKKKIEILYNKKIKLYNYIICQNNINSTIHPQSDCKSFIPESNKFIDNICSNKHYSINIPLNSKYKGGNFKFCNENKIIKIKKNNTLIFDSREVYEVTPILYGKRLVLIAWFSIV